ncbi:MAG TPA: Na/Pi symporter [Longimicrobiales bacterium]|nr:Na/Pi symporter [Longimicrobiales bacterium]
MIGSLLGGIGLFLLGMILMTDGLKAAAGDALRRGLERLTGGAFKAMLSGMAITALVQSSSATVLTTIGFVSAGLLTFTQAVGLIFGANLGTTSTGWIVSVVGFKVSVAAVALPLVGVGALARFLLRGRAASVGLALAGFGVIFVGIDLLQDGMASLSDRMDPGSLPGATLLGRMALVGVGAAMTVVLQSSSAAVTTTLTALHSGTIGLAQAVALVIGQNLGTTATAAMAAVGASVPAKRTALAHILFNVVAGVAAFALAPAFLFLVEDARWLPGAEDPAVAVAAFHTIFNVAGVLLLLPVSGRFAAVVTRMVPDRGSPFARNLDTSVAEVPAVGVEVARRAVMEIAAEQMRVAAGVFRRMDGGPPPPSPDPASQGLREVRSFLGHVRTSSSSGDHARHLGVLHALDHLDRLDEALREPPGPDRLSGGETGTLRGSAEVVLEEVRAWLEGRGPAPEDRSRSLSQGMARHRRARRLEVLALAASGEVGPEEALERLEALRWLDRVMYHVWRSVHHLAAEGGGGVDHHTEAFAESED